MSAQHTLDVVPFTKRVSRATPHCRGVPPVLVTITPLPNLAAPACLRAADPAIVTLSS